MPEEAEKSSDKAVEEILAPRKSGDEKVKSMEELNEKFSYKRFDPNYVKPEDKKQEEKEEKKEETKSEEGGPTYKPEEKKKAFVPSLIEKNKATEAQLKKIQEEFDSYKKTTESKISEYQTKIDSGNLSAAKEKELEGKIKELQSQYTEKEETLVNENKAMRDRLELLNMQESEEFKTEYIAPVENAFKVAVQITTDDKQRKLLHRAMVANAASLQAVNDTDRAAAEEERDSSLSLIAESLSEFSRGRFVDAMTKYITATQRHSAALSEGQKTAMLLKQKEKEKIEKSRNQILIDWGKSYSAIEPQYDEDAKLAKELEPILKELKIDLGSELEESATLAKKTITARASMNESIEMIHRGRVYPALKAKIAVLTELNSQLKKTIEKQRSSQPSGGGDSSTQSDKKETREEWESRKFGAGRFNK